MSEVYGEVKSCLLKMLMCQCYSQANHSKGARALTSGRQERALRACFKVQLAKPKGRFQSIFGGLLVLCFELTEGRLQAAVKLKTSCSPSSEQAARHGLVLAEALR